MLDSGISGEVSANGGDIAINADVATLSSGVVETSGTITWETVASSRAITLGSEVAGTLSLTDAELDLLDSSTLMIGSATAGAIDV